MIKRALLGLLLALMWVPLVIAQTSSENQEQVYLNKLTYRRNKLQIITKKRMAEERREYTTHDIDLGTYSIEAYTYTTGQIETQRYSRFEPKEWTEWYIMKGGVRVLSDLEFLQIVGDQGEYHRVQALEDQKAKARFYGNLAIGLGLATMLGGAAFSASQNVIVGAGMVTALGFFVSAFNLSPPHYLEPDYVQEKIDEYNVNLKKKLNLPLDFE